MILREAIEGDFESIQKIYGYYIRNGYSTFELSEPTINQMVARWKYILGQGHPYLVSEDGGVIFGYAYASTFRFRSGYNYTLENSVYVSPQFLNQGIGYKLLESLLERCTELGFRQMVAVIGDSNNEPSFRLHRKCGFERVGLLPSTGFKHGRWVDTVLMQRPLGLGDKTLA